MAIDLSPEDIDELSNKDPLPLPDAFCAMGTVLSASPEDLERGAFRLSFTMMVGPSGARLLGRFCHADRRLQALVEAHLRAEEACRPDAIFAEITHLPEGRVGNIACRPVLREHEIVFLGRSGAPDERQIPVTELMVSVTGDRILLRSKRLGREVIPRMTNAHNFAVRSLGMYRFLCSLQGQGSTGGLGWSWGALDSAPFLPRVTSGKLILSRALWNLTEKEIHALGAAHHGAALEAVSQLRSARKLPRWVALQEGDHELPLDLENVLSVEAFVHLVKQRTRATLVEMFPDELCAEGPEGRFVHEIVLPFVRTPREAPKATSRPIRSVAPSQCAFPPGSAWLYAKLYTGTVTADRILFDTISPIVARAMRAGGARRWFFIRYGDPEWHLRLRFHGDPARLHSDVLPALHAGVAPLLEGGLVWKLQLDTYERETERYGGHEGMELSEQVFHADSDAVLELVGFLARTEGADDARWRLALCGMDMLLDDFKLDLGTKLAVAERARRAFASEFRANVALTRTLGDKHRKESKALGMLLERATGDDDDAVRPLSPGIEILRRRSERLAPVSEALRAAEQAPRLWLPVTDVVPSYLHMFANRLLHAEARAQELVLYDFLARLYGSRLARARRQP
ncbi:lantibiotic dehydratase [Sorangium sp. So ce1128]